MRLLFLRHGIAEDRQSGLADADRRLTPEGIEQMRVVARGMRTLDLKITAVFTSPLVRARETAELAVAELGLEAALQQTHRLASGCDFGDLQALLKSRPAEARVLLVGHEPDFSEMIATLIGGGYVRMKKAALACVDTAEVQSGRGELLWLAPPAHLVALGQPPA